MKTKSLLILFFTANAFLALAQESTSVQYTRDIGFNSNFILRGLFETSETPFSFMYKSYRSAKKAMRYGISANLRVSTTTKVPIYRCPLVSVKSFKIIFPKSGCGIMELIWPLNFLKRIRKSLYEQ